MNLARCRASHTFAIVLVSCSSWAEVAVAQPVSTGAGLAYPVKPIRMLFGYTAGGAGDVSARMLAQKLAENLGQNVVVENRPGAGGAIADEAVAKAPADGYTLLYAAGSTLFCRRCVQSCRTTSSGISRRCRWWSSLLSCSRCIRRCRCATSRR